MMEYTLTRVWNIDNQLVVADTVEEAIQIMRKYFSNNSDYLRWEPKFIEAVKTTIIGTNDYTALIKKQ